MCRPAVSCAGFDWFTQARKRMKDANANQPKSVLGVSSAVTCKIQALESRCANKRNVWLDVVTFRPRFNPKPPTQPHEEPRTSHPRPSFTLPSVKA